MLNARPGAQADLRADDAVAAEEFLLLAEHVHRAALAVRISAGASGQLRHHAARFHAGRQHMAVIAIGGDDLVAVAERQLHADDDGFLADIEMAEAANQAHAVKLAGLFLEPADQQHAAIGFQQHVPVHRFIFGSCRVFSPQLPAPYRRLPLRLHLPIAAH